MPDVKEYKIEFPQAKIDRLVRKLNDAEFPEEVEDGNAWDYGSPVKDVKRIVAHWKDKFDWKEHEKKLNELPNYEVAIDVDGFGSVDVHFVHQRSDVAGAIPLLFIHGWPGSFLEVTKLLPMLKGGDGRPAFNVVAPSMPNYGFSGKALKRNFRVKQYAETCNKLMQTLGYDQYVVQGGDFGMLVARALALLHPQQVKAHHINWAWAGKPAEFTDGTKPEPEYSEREKKQMAIAERWNPFGAGDGRGYVAMQSTRPATINFAFRDSPVALLAWVYDKLIEWSDDYPWTDDEVCLWISIYVMSRAGPEASTFIYYEMVHDATDAPIPVLQGNIDCPLGISDFPFELANSPAAWRHTMGPIVFQKLHPHGGHFAAYEQPKELAGDLCEMFGKDGGAFGVVEGRSGYK